jgi:hypothetical protein
MLSLQLFEKLVVVSFLLIFVVFLFGSCVSQTTCDSEDCSPSSHNSNSVSIVSEFFSKTWNIIKNFYTKIKGT